MTVPSEIAAAHERAAQRLLDARASVRAAFDKLDTGVTFDDLTTYIEPDFHAKAIYGAINLDAAWGRIVGVVAAAAITIVESDRAKRSATAGTEGNEQLTKEDEKP